MSRHHTNMGTSWRKLVATIIAADDVCWLCHHRGADTADHVIPVSLGGTHMDAQNLRPAHHKACPTCRRKCNISRGNKTQLPAWVVDPSPSRRWFG